MVIPCLIEYVHSVTDQKCLAFLKRLQPVIFGDYRLIYKFVDRCGADIDKFQCGRLQHDAVEVNQTVLLSILALKKALQRTSMGNPTPPLWEIWAHSYSVFLCGWSKSITEGVLAGNTKIASKIKDEGPWKLFWYF